MMPTAEPHQPRFGWANNPNPPYAPRTSSRQGPARSAGFRLPALFHNARTTAGPVRVQFYRERRSIVGGDGGASGVANSSRNLPPTKAPAIARYRALHFRERAERASLMSEASTPGVLLAGSQWRPQNGADGRHFRSFQCWPLPCRDGGTDSRLENFIPRGPPKTSRCKRDNSSPRRHRLEQCLRSGEGQKTEKISITDRSEYLLGGLSWCLTVSTELSTPAQDRQSWR